MVATSFLSTGTLSAVVPLRQTSSVEPPRHDPGQSCTCIRLSTCPITVLGTNCLYLQPRGNLNFEIYWGHFVRLAAVFHSTIRHPPRRSRHLVDIDLSFTRLRGWWTPDDNRAFTRPGTFCFQFRLQNRGGGPDCHATASHHQHGHRTSARLFSLPVEQAVRHYRTFRSPRDYAQPVP